VLLKGILLLQGKTGISLRTYNMLGYPEINDKIFMIIKSPIQLNPPMGLYLIYLIFLTRSVAKTGPFSGRIF
jgi:hypothetical protein